MVRVLVLREVSVAGTAYGSVDVQVRLAGATVGWWAARPCPRHGVRLGTLSPFTAAAAEEAAAVAAMAVAAAGDWFGPPSGSTGTPSGPPAAQTGQRAQP